MQTTRKVIPLDACSELFPELAQELPGINQALRNINFGKMDFLPYENAVPGYQLAMRADLRPQGDGKPPAMGHWQIEVIRDDAPYRLYLQGKAKAGQELAEIVVMCESEEILGHLSSQLGAE